MKDIILVVLYPVRLKLMKIWEILRQETDEDKVNGVEGYNHRNQLIGAKKVDIKIGINLF